MNGFAITDEGHLGSIQTSMDAMTVTLDNDTDFSGFGDGVIPRGFYATTAGNVNVITADGHTRLLPVIADKDYLIAVRRFLVTSTTVTAIVAFK